MLFFFVGSYLWANTQTFTRIYRDKQGFTGIYRDKQGFTRIYRDKQGFTGIYRDKQGFTRIYRDKQTFTGIYRDINIPTKGRLMCAKAIYFLAVAKWCYLYNLQQRQRCVRCATTRFARFARFVQRFVGGCVGQIPQWRTTYPYPRRHDERRNKTIYLSSPIALSTILCLLCGHRAK